MKTSARLILPLLFGFVLLSLWEALVGFYEIPPYILPSPRDIGESLWVDGPSLLAALAITLQVTVAAMILACVTGVGIAVLLVQSKLLERMLFPYAVFLQVTPIVTIAPFIIIWVDSVFVVLLILAWMAAVFPIISNTLLGLKSADRNLHDLFKLYSASRSQTLRRLLIPAALPYFLGGLRISGGLALIGTVVAEMVAGTSGESSGLASRLLEASYRLELARALACFVLLSITGYGIYAVLNWVSNRLLRHWHESALDDPSHA
ncbi:MAG: ABC transporter permease [Rhodospirillaceae bacterium]|jgi:NitT/TauT family transport system permease protein|nr:ABC transporter permease [Rhodospirillaceae bacterium]MBT5239682.1 ABC transporter permease [Rhodospirillaceae bacterium]MBT5567099.1 ABC transporter permease [Rhodospirillaceae bacterium]MBT6089313.1 ABC transporter permease [Rhodospirillaceae bacterium]